jgi:drug/metabolite transporter (DMT)-like permease
VVIPLRAYIALALAQVFVGSLVVVGKVIAAGFPVFLASALRSIIGVAVLLPLLLWREGRLPRVTLRDALYLFLIAFTGMFLFSIFLLYGLRLTTATEGGIIISTAPAMLGVFAFLFMGERFTHWRGLAIGLAVAGMVALRAADGGAGAIAPSSGVGNLLVFGAAVGEALFSALGKPVSRTLSPLAIATYVTFAGLVMFLPFGLWEARSFDFAAVPPLQWLPIVYYGVFITAGAFLLWYWALARVPASTAAVFLGILPISGVLLSYGVLGEQFRWGHLFGLAAVLAGIACIAVPEWQASRPVTATPPGGASAKH